jgi:amidohydrolase
VRGRGGHAARPHITIDPKTVAAPIITALQTLVSREVAAQEQAVVTVANLEAGTTFNVIPDTAVLRGTVRTYSPVVQDFLEKRIAEVAGGIASAMRATAEVEYRRGYPPLVNHAAGVELVTAVATEMLGRDAIEERVLAMGAEDFSFVLQGAPGAMFWLGVRDPSWPEPRPVHSSSFDLDERALPLGAALLTASALRFLAPE